MHTAEAPYEPATPEVASWVERLNAINKERKAGTLNDAKWMSFLQERFSGIVSPRSRTQSNGIRFNGLTFEGVNFGEFPCFQDQGKHDWQGCRFVKCVLQGVALHSCNFQESEFLECVGSASFQDSDLTSCRFKECDLRNSNFLNALLIGTSVAGCNLRHADLSRANLTGADFRSVEFDANTRVRALESVKDWKVDRYTIACLKGDDSDLTTGNLMDMRIRDDVAELRKQFSGLLGFLHLSSLVVFLAPYGWFLVSHWAEAKFLPKTQDSIPLWKALLQYFVNAGVDWQSGFNPSWWLLATVAIVIYNLVRFVLLWKTNRLETAEQISGVPVRFSLVEPIEFPRLSNWLRVPQILDWLSAPERFPSLIAWLRSHPPCWNWFYFANKFGYVVYLVLVALKTGHFLTMRIPLHL